MIDEIVMVEKGKETPGSHWLLVVLLLAAFALRLQNIDVFSFWTDEALTPLRAGYPLSQILQNEIVIQDVVTEDSHPPFFYLLIHFTRLGLGESDFAYRYPSLLAGLLLIPLLFQLGRRLHNRYLGLLVAALTAVNPLYIWYANEARMYTLFVLLMAGAAYALWQALAGADLRRWLLIYLVLAGLGLYTHYTAGILIAAQAPFWLWLLWQQGQKKLIIAGAVAGALAAIPVIPFTIPRLFTGAEANYSYISPIVMLQDVVRFFSLGLTVDFGQMGITLLALAAAGLLLLGVYAAGSWTRRAFLLTYLLAVVLGLMAGSLLKPMYQGVRHIMVGSPAFLLLVGWAIVFAGERAWSRPDWSKGWLLVFITGLLTLVIGPAIALHNLYTRPDLYAKDDFRNLIAQMETMAGENDVIVYNNAIHLPLHDHYHSRPDVAVAAVPVYPTLAIHTAEPDLVGLAQNYDRIWFVTDPPADDRDSDKLAQQWLQANLLPLTRLEDHAHSTIVESFAFATIPLTTTAGADNQAINRQWPDLPTLHAFQLDNRQPVTGTTLWFRLYWQSQPVPPETAVLRISLHDSQGWEWTARTQPLHPPNITWPTTNLVQLPYWLTLPRAMPPGEYQLRLQPFVAEQPLAEAQTVATIPLAASPLPAVPWFTPQRLKFNNGLQLAGWEWADTAVYPGHNLPLTLYWQAATPLALEGLRYELTIYRADGTPLRQQAGRPGAAWLPTIPADSLIREQTSLYIRPETPPGRYRLHWRLLADDEVIPGRPYWRPWATESIILGQFLVADWPLDTNLPPDVTGVGATFGSAINLHGYRLAPDANQLQLELIWQAVDHPHSDLMLFVHLLSPQNELVTQVDRIPGNGLRPLNGWRQGEVITDKIRFSLPADLTPGTYQIMVGFYQPEEGYRLPVMFEGGAQLYDQLLLTTVNLP